MKTRPDKNQESPSRRIRRVKRRVRKAPPRKYEVEKTLLDDKFFRKIFSEPSMAPCLLDLLNAVFRNANEPTLKSVKVKVPSLHPFFSLHKRSTLDLLAEEEGNGRLVDVEVQTYRDSRFLDRLLYYGAKLLASQLRQGDKYDKLRRVVCVAFVKSDVWGQLTRRLETQARELGRSFQDAYYETFRIRADQTGVVYCDLLTILLVRVPDEKLDFENCRKNFRDAELPVWLRALGIRAATRDALLAKFEKRMPNLKRLRKEMGVFLNVVNWWNDRQEYNSDLLDAWDAGVEQGVEQGVKIGVEQGVRKAQVELVASIVSQKFNLEQGEVESALQDKYLDNAVCHMLVTQASTCPDYESFLDCLSKVSAT